MLVEECCSLVDLYTGICVGSIQVPSTSRHPFEFHETFKERPFSVIVVSKQSGPFQPCDVAAKLEEVAAFGNYLKLLLRVPGILILQVPVRLSAVAQHKTLLPVELTYTRNLLLACMNSQ